MSNRYLWGLTAFILPIVFIGPRMSAQASETDDKSIFGLARLHRVSLTLSKLEWDVLQTSSGFGGGGDAGKDYTRPDGRIVHGGGGFRGFFPWVHADFGIDGREIKDAGLRYKGNLSFTSSSAASPFRANFKLKTDMFGGKASWNGE